MLKIAPILAVLAVVTAGSIPANAKSNVSLQVLTPQQMDEYLKQNPLAQPFNREDSPGQAREIVVYTLGARQSGDRISAYDAGTNSWSTPTEVTLTISYPSSGTGDIITFMRIEVSQSNSLGRAYVTSGGVGYRYIKVIVEAHNTLYFNWSHNIYGK